MTPRRSMTRAKCPAGSGLSPLLVCVSAGCALPRYPNGGARGIWLWYPFIRCFWPNFSKLYIILKLLISTFTLTTPKTIFFDLDEKSAKNLVFKNLSFFT